MTVTGVNVTVAMSLLAAIGDTIPLDLWFERVVKPPCEAKLTWCNTSVTWKLRPHAGTDQDQTGRIWLVRAATREQARQEAPRDHLFPGLHAVLHARETKKATSREIAVGDNHRAQFR
jgi:hypothetical protein